MDDLSVNLNKLQIGCLYAGTIMNHMMYADDLCVFSPSVAGLRKLTDCCAKYGNIFDIMYNAKKSFCMVIDNKPRDKKNIHPVVINNHTLPYTEKCKYLGQKFYLCDNSIKTTLFNSYCGSMYTSSLWCHLKKQSLKGITVAYNNSFRIIHNLSPCCSASHMFATNYVKSFNERIRFYAGWKNPTIYFL